MKQIVFLIIIAISVSFIGCDKLGGIRLFSSSDTLEAYKLKMDSTRRADSILAVKKTAMLKKKKEKARQDSIKKVREIEAAKAKNRFLVIAGSFKTPQYAKEYEDLMTKRGYTVEKVRNEYNFECISIYATDTYSKAFRKIKELQTEQGDEVEFWVYERK